VALLSAAAIAAEILFMRLLSIALWHHFAYMVISLALLGYGASGTLLSLADRWLVPRFGGIYPAAAALFGLAVPGAFALAGRVPFSPLEVAWNPRELFGLASIYLLLAVPYLCGGTAVGLALMRFPGGTGRLYGADLGGAGVGAAAVIGALFALPPEEAVLALGGCGFAAAALGCLGRPDRRRRPGRGTWIVAGVLLLAGVATVALWPRSTVEPRMSQFKGLPMALRVPGVEVASERFSPLGSLTAVESRRVPLRHAPGLSLASKAGPPEQVGVFVDGDSMTTIDRLEAGPEDDLEGVGSAAYRDDLSSALPYHVLDAPGGAGLRRVLVLGAGGGSEVLGALAQGAERVDAVELDPRMVELVGDRFAEFSGHLYGRDDVAVHVAEARGFVAGERSRGDWDLIQVALLDSFSASAAGVHALSESHLYTVEALEAFVQRLAPGGVLAVTRWLEVPPRGSLKLFATAVEALERSGGGRGTEDPGSRLLLVRSWKTATLLVAERPFTRAEIAAAREFAEGRWFDLAWAPVPDGGGMTRAEANRFNVWEEPYLHDGAVEILAGGGRRERFFERYKFFVEPATDDRPYFFRFFKWRVLPELLALRGRGGTHLVEWGYPVLVATLLQALAFGLVLIVVPAGWLIRSEARARSGDGGGAAGREREEPGLARIGLYFLCLGIGFLFVEIAFIQRFTLFLAHPLYAVAVVLAGFLVFAGAGSAASSRWGRSGSGRVGPIGGAALGVGGLALLYTVALPPLFAVGVGWADWVKVGVALALIAPLAWCMGMPFPLGLERVAAARPSGVPWAWAVNGCASVVAAVLAVLLAVHCGFTVVVAAAGGVYAVAAWVGRGL
jgi:SAM-dependent methyltransferase